MDVREQSFGTTLGLNLCIRFLPVVVAIGGIGYLMAGGPGLLCGVVIGLVIAASNFF